MVHAPQRIAAGFVTVIAMAAAAGHPAAQESRPVSAAVPRALAPADLLPPDAALIAEIRDPAAMIQKFAAAGWADRLKSTRSWPEYIQSADGLRLIGGMAVLRAAAGVDLDRAFAGVAGGGVAMAVRPRPSAGAPLVTLVMRGHDAGMTARLRDALAELAGIRSLGEWHADRVSIQQKITGSGGAVEIVGYQSFFHAIAGEYLVMANDAPEVAAALDRLDAGTATPRNVKLKDAMAVAGESDAWVWFDAGPFARFGASVAARAAEPSEPLPALLFGGWKQVVAHAPWLAASLRISSGEVEICLDAPGLPELSKTTFVPAAASVPVLRVPGAIGTLTIRRDINSFWNDHAGLVPPELDGEFAKFNTTAGTIFGVRRMDEDVFPHLLPVAHFVFARQTYRDLPAPPKVKIPATALILQLKENQKKVADGFRRAFQTAVALSAADAAQKGRPALGLAEDSSTGRRIDCATYPEPESAADVSIEYNFSPAFFVKDRFVVLSSTLELAREVMATLDGPGRPAGAVLDEWAFDGSAARDAVAENAPALVANNMLTKGTSKAAAEREVGILLDLMSIVAKFEGRVEAGASGMRFALRAEPATAASKPASRPRRAER
jgi:hypothetical protein